MNDSLKHGKALKPQYKGIPKRYEDTKPVQTQAFTHKTILDIGQNIHVKWENVAEAEKHQAIKVAEDAVWEHATHFKEIAIGKCKAAAEQVLEKKVQELGIELTKAVKEETSKIESEMKALALEQVKKEMEHADEVLKETLIMLTAEKAEESIAAIADARREEVAKAAAEAERVASTVAEKAAEVAKGAAYEKDIALEEVAAKLKQERLDVVLDAQMEERRAAVIELGKIQTAHGQEIAKLKHEIKTLQTKCRDSRRECQRENTEKQDWIKKHDALKSSYQLFIDETKGFKKGQAEYLL